MVGFCAPPPALILHLSNRNPMDAQPTGIPSFQRSVCPSRESAACPVHTHGGSSEGTQRLLLGLWSPEAESSETPGDGHSHVWQDDEMLMESRPRQPPLRAPLRTEGWRPPQTLTLQ